MTQVPTPATQLTTDDWAPVYQTPTGSVNLGIKAIIGLAAAGQIADDPRRHTPTPRPGRRPHQDNVGRGSRCPPIPRGSTSTSSRAPTGTWSTLYNAYYEQVIGVAARPRATSPPMQASFYLTQLTTYGMPLQTDAGDLSKVAWLFYHPGLAQRLPDPRRADEPRRRRTSTTRRHACRTATGTTPATGVEVTGVEAHPTLGAVFALLVGGS